MEYLKSAFNYTGQKYNLLNQLYEYFPLQKDFDIFVDAFCGGGSVFVNSNYENIIVNDIIKPLINFYNEIKSVDSFDILVKNIHKHVLDKNDKNGFLEKRELFNTTGATDPYMFFCLLQCCTNNMIRFNKKFLFNQTFGNRSYNKNTEQKLYEYYKKINNSNIKFVNYDYRDLFNSLLKRCDIKNKKMFVYIDPPYLITEAGYNAFWSKELENDLYVYIDKLHNKGHLFILSNVSTHKGIINPNLDKLKKYNIIELEHNYDKVSRKENNSDSVEIIVKNF